ncbi:metallophosphoesterase [Flavobacteriaceae bacterium]|nr:metallophosphoesterase [Flavobacteriaceae bacterium]MDC1492848.1 metallophosphoesterase [Flavobacteriaceae bacterium]
MKWLFFFLFIIFIDLYSYQSIKNITKNKIVKYSYFIVSFLVVFYFFYKYKLQAIGTNSSLALGLLISFYSPKLILIIINFSEDVIRLIVALAKRMFNYNKTIEIPSRRKFVSKLGIALASVPFFSLNLGMIWGKNNTKVLKYTLFFDDLPSSFDGYQLTQISDIHAGNLSSLDKLKDLIQLVNTQKSDVIFFTGDLVNNEANELNPWLTTLSKLKSKDGIYSILGNHDYGDYRSWPSEKEKIDNFNKIKEYQKQIGFDLLLNESQYIKKGNQKLAIIGVENWGNGFRKYGDLSKASKKIKSDDFKILLSHDPTHWQKKVLNNEYNYHLTLSGHTHGGQFGIEIPGYIKWSPVKWRYKYWAGIYKEKNKYLNVNRGLGTTAVPGRVGIWPEITVITLKSTNNA